MYFSSFILLQVDMIKIRDETSNVKKNMVSPKCYEIWAQNTNIILDLKSFECNQTITTCSFCLCILNN